jgi:hypothetical protein
VTFGCGCECLLEIAVCVGTKDKELLPYGLCRPARVSQLFLAFRRAIRVHKDANHLGFRHQLSQQLQPFRPKLLRRTGSPRWYFRQAG